tara:strand:+ start:1989 stop:2264 length:276 start_codon:yes stop_codon:yes gene_type:complete
MGYKQPSSGLPFKQIGSSPAKQGKTKLGEKIRALVSVPFGKESYKDLKKSQRLVRKVGFHPGDVSNKQLRKISQGENIGDVLLPKRNMPQR